MGPLPAFTLPSSLSGLRRKASRGRSRSVGRYGGLNSRVSSGQRGSLLLVVVVVVRNGGGGGDGDRHELTQLCAALATPAFTHGGRARARERARAAVGAMPRREEWRDGRRERRRAAAGVITVRVRLALVRHGAVVVRVPQAKPVCYSVVRVRPRPLPSHDTRETAARLVSNSGLQRRPQQWTQVFGTKNSK